MMKKILSLILSTVICFSCVACGGTGATNGDENINVTDTKLEVETEDPALALERNYYSAVEEALAMLQDRVKNPASLRINNVIVWSKTENTTVSQVEDKVGSMDLLIYVDFTAKNGFGNEIDDYACCAFNNVIFDQTDTYPVYYRITHNKNDNYEEVMDGYFKGVGGNSVGSVCFELDLADFESEGYLLP